MLEGGQCSLHSEGPWAESRGRGHGQYLPTPPRHATGLLEPPWAKALSPRLGRLLGQGAVTAGPKTHIAAGKGSGTAPVSGRMCRLPIHPLSAHALL